MSECFIDNHSPFYEGSALHYSDSTDSLAVLNRCHDERYSCFDAIRYGALFETFGGTHFVNHGTVPADVAGQTLTLNNSVTTNTANVSVSASFSVGGSFTQTAGHTVVDGTLSRAQTFQLQGGSLTGSGSIIGNVDNSGAVVGPGDSPGLLSLTGAYNQQSSGLFDVELGGIVAGARYDQLKVTGQATLAGSIKVDLLPGFLPTVGEQFDVMLRGSDSGTFANLLSNTLGLGYVVDYQANHIIVTITAVPVPEPATVVLFACGALLIVAQLRHRKISRSECSGISGAGPTARRFGHERRDQAGVWRSSCLKLT